MTKIRGFLSDWMKLISECSVFIRAMIVVMWSGMLSRRRLCHMSGVMWSCMGTSRCSDRRTWSCLWSKLTQLTMSSVEAIMLVYAPITLFCILICTSVLVLYSIYNMHIITVLSILPLRGNIQKKGGYLKTLSNQVGGWWWPFQNFSNDLIFYIWWGQISLW